jgi:hypothetical protein
VVAKRRLLADPLAMRINVFSADGRAVDTWPVPGFSQDLGRGTVTVDRRGTVWVPVTLPGERGATGWRPGGFALVRNGRIVDTVADVRASMPMPPQLEAATPRGRRQMHVPFMPQGFAAISPLGYWVAGVNTTYSLYLNVGEGGRGADGKPLVRRVVRIDGPSRPAVPVEAMEARDYRRNIEGLMRATVPSWQWSGPTIPKNKPAFADLWIDQDGRIWVRPHGRVLAPARNCTESPARIAHLGLRPAGGCPEP